MYTHRISKSPSIPLNPERLSGKVADWTTAHLSSTFVSSTSTASSSSLSSLDESESDVQTHSKPRNRRSSPESSDVDLVSSGFPQTQSSPKRKRKLNLSKNDRQGKRRRVAPAVPAPSTSRSFSGQKVKNKNQGYLAGAHNFTIEKPNMYDIKVVQNEGSETLVWLEKHIMSGAEFNSYERDPPPRCHPGTRTSIVDRINGWVDDTKRIKRALWLRGPAGVGKSAIVQTLAEKLSETQKVGASLFFSRPNGRSNPQQVFPTLAYQLAIQDPAYKAYLMEIMSKDPRSLDKAMSEQFRVLIVEPFVRRNIRSGQADLLIAIDGLDECAGDPGPASSDQPTPPRGRTSEQVHCEIVRLIARFTQAHPSAPLIWIIASRPEIHLKAVFASGSVLPSFWEEDIPVDSDEACRDVEKFLHASFTRIQEDYPYHFHESPWPTHEQFLVIAKAASGLFVFAEVIIRFIEDPRVGNPVAQLEYVLSAISKLRLSQDQTNPLAVLDAIYKAILSKIPPAVLENTKSLLRLLIFLNRKSYTVASFPFRHMYEYVGIPRSDAIAALQHLHSVVHFPRVKAMDDTRPRFYHASFRDYLKDPSRSDKYAINDLTMLEFGPAWSPIIPSLFGSVPVEGSLPLDHECSEQESYSLLGSMLQSKNLSPSGVSVDLKDHRCSIFDTQLQSIFESLSFKQMVRTNWWYCFRCLRLCDVQGWQLDELKRREILSVTSLRSLNIHSIQGIHSTKEVFSYNFLIIDLESSNLPQKPNPEREQLCTSFTNLLSDAPDTPIYVWGFKDGERCAVIIGSDLPVSWPARTRLSIRSPVFIVGF